MKTLSKCVCLVLLGLSLNAFADSSATSANTNVAASTGDVNSPDQSNPAKLLTPAAKLVTHIIGSQGTIIESFQAAPGLTGFVVRSNQGANNSGIVYADNQGQYLFVGSLVNAAGNDLTQYYTQEHINNKIAGPAYSAALQATSFTSGSDKAPHKAIIIIDPNCVYCHLLYKQLKPLLDNGQVQIRWIPVAFRSPSSPGKAAAMLNAGANAAAVLDQNEKDFNDQTEEGSISPLQPNPAVASVTAAFNSVAQNTQFFSKFGFQGTPTILYKKNDGTVVLVPGYVQGNEFQSMINSMGANGNN